jgi:hypothetical protein
MSPVDTFIVFALPRSRTTWLSRYLSYGAWVCGHDEAVRMRWFDDIGAWLSLDKTGSVETAVAPFWRTVLKLSPGIRVATIRRPVSEVVESTINAGAPEAARDALTREMTKLDHKLDQIEKRIPGVLSVKCDDLASERVCAKLFEHCLGLEHDFAWWADMDRQNIQINFPWLIRYVQAHKPQLDKLVATAKCATLRDLALKPPGGKDDIVIAEESLAVMVRDAQEMFSRHSFRVGEHPESFNEKNIALGRRVEAMGKLQVITARCNGRIFGYLMTVIGPSLESVTRVSATHTLFYAGEEFPGLGLKMQRVALERLRQRGVSEVFLHDGVRGSGGRNNVIYRRLGAKEFGSLYRLDMEVA